ncbi:MAG TPA: ATP-dependent carboxylate-amine ligase [Micromonosporaceae bacterium]|nr:ATP-dependent carboxylate-amine ligase [Micromonosporaceae bacterium]
MSTVLILTQEFDSTVDPVVVSLRERGSNVVRVDLSYFPQTLTFTSSDFDDERLRMRHGDRDIDLESLTGVWYRRPTAFVFDSAMGEAEQQFARTESVHGVGGILRGTDCLWVNRPDLDAVAELKPFQLRIAKRLGFRVPRTLMTNDPQEVTALLDRADGPFVYKAFTGGVVHYPGGFPNGLFTVVVGDELREHIDRVRHTICIFQEYIEKAYEVRLTVIGNTFFPVVVDSQSMSSTRVDWRGEDMMPYGDYRPLPEQVVKQVEAMLSELGLAYAAVDLIVTPDGEYVFLELNPGGQFMWIQHDIGLDMSGCMAELLMSGEPFRRGDTVQVGY